MTWVLAFVLHGEIQRAELMPDGMVCEAARSAIVHEIPRWKHKRWQCVPLTE